MITLAESRGWRLAAFGLLNLSQGLPWGFITAGYFYLLTDLKLPPEQVGGAIALARLPWAFKMVWGLVYDRFPGSRWGRRRPFIIASQALLGVAIGSLMFIPDPAKQLWLVSGVLFCTSLFTTMQNVATNGMGVDLIGADERGRMNAVMWASKSVGVAIGGGGCYALSTTVPWPFLMLAMAVVIWLIGLIPLLVRERPGEGTASAPASRLEVREIVRTFAAPAPVIALVAAFLLPMGFGLLGTPLNYLLRSGLGFSEHRIGFLTGLVDAAVGIVASLAGGFLADRFGSRTVMTIASLGMIASTSWLATTADHWHSFTFMTTWYVVQFSFQYMFGAAMLTFFMSMANPSIGATHLGIYFAINNLCYTCADRWGGQLLSEFGYVQTFAVCAVVQALALIPLAMCDPRFAERMYRRPAEAKPAASA